MKGFQQGIGAVVLFVSILALAAITYGWTLSILWGWFIVPIFRLPALSLGGAIGVAYTVRFLTTTANTDKSKRSWGETVGTAIGVALLGPLFTLGIGWIIHLFVATK